MTLLAAHINDASISLASAERTLYSEPGFALLEQGDIVTGEAARASSRLKPRSINLDYWSELSTTALSDARFAHLSSADLVSQQLEALWRLASDGDQLIVAVPSSMQRDQLALFLGIANELGIPILGLCNAAVAATRREYRDAVPIHIDFGLHTSTLTRLTQSAGAQYESAELVTDAGVQSLAAAWRRKISDCFVNQSRFDPLHTAETEQLLANRLPDWLAEASRSATVPMRIDYRGLQHEAEIEAIDLIAAASPVYQRIVAQLRALLKAGEVPAIQLTDRAARMPGLGEMLTARGGGETFMLEPGATTRGLLARFDVSGGVPDNVGLTQRLGWDQSAVSIEAMRPAAATALPTHVLFGSQAYPLSGDSLNLGSQQDAASRWIDFERDMPGLSRQHCTLTLEHGQCVLKDRSRYGTFLNGHRIADSAVLQNGDVIRVGTPGFELQLIRVID